MKRRVVITGIGVISSIGTGKEAFMQGILDGKDGKKDIPYFECDKYSLKKAHIVEGFDKKEYCLKSGIIEKEPANVYGLYASKQALDDAGITTDMYPNDRKGVSIASSLGSINGKADIHSQVLAGKRFNEIDFLPAFECCSTPSGVVAKEFDCFGPNISVSTACAAGTNSIGCALDMIQNGTCDMVIAGGSDPFEQMSFSGFISLMTITKNEIMPFDKNRSGIDIGEGAAILILESLDGALARGAHIYAEVLGYGISNDAYHATSPEPSGSGAKKAMSMAINQAGIKFEDVEYINAHGTGTKINDKMEIGAIKSLFGDHAFNLYVSSTKSMHGHMLGATGSIEIIACALALKEGFVPATTKTTELMDECVGMNIVLGKPLEKQVRIVLSNSFGFAGNSSSIVLSRYE